MAGLALLSLGCGRSPGATNSAAAPPLFERLAPESTGVRFQNTLTETRDFNILNYLDYYNGGGVAVGDVDGNGYPDLYFSSNLGPNRLYLNMGNYRFVDATDRAGVAGPEGWKTGVTMVDIDGDGDLDIFVCAVNYLGMHGHNVLYINDGHGVFSDQTKAFGLEFSGYSTQAAFFDYDGDGDLDMYLLNHSTHVERGIEPALRTAASSPSTDRLYRNDGGHFTDVTEQAGMTDRVGGFGLGVVVSDLNGDGCPDVYVANDFQENDFLYVNRCNGTFTDVATTALAHTSRSSMGVDAADFNNDGRPDLMVVDMMPEREDVFKTSSSYDGPDLFDARLRAGYMPQYPRNVLQLNRGAGRFSEIGYQAGVFASDWSWAPLFADLDNDGQKDLFITNGIFRRPNDLDYINYVSAQAVQATLGQDITDANLTLLKLMPQVPLPNHAFHNDGNLHFTDMAAPWGLAQPGFSNGAAYVDLNHWAPSTSWSTW
ncbi:MAG: VCBS repeat-containing protein [Gemmatimonadaceae bacterium]